MSNVDRTRTHAVSAVAAAEQQPEGWRFVTDTILPGYQWVPQWVPARTPTIHWGPISGKAVGGPNINQHSSTVQKHGKQLSTPNIHNPFQLVTPTCPPPHCQTCPPPGLKKQKSFFKKYFQVFFKEKEKFKKRFKKMKKSQEISFFSNFFFKKMKKLKIVNKLWWSTWHSELVPQAHFSLLGESLPASLEIAEVARTTAGRPVSSALLESTWSVGTRCYPPCSTLVSTEVAQV